MVLAVIVVMVMTVIVVTFVVVMAFVVVVTFVVNFLPRTVSGRDDQGEAAYHDEEGLH